MGRLLTQGIFSDTVSINVGDLMRILFSGSRSYRVFLELQHLKIFLIEKIRKEGGDQRPAYV